ncbi:MAG: hypothetical protein ACLFM7_02580 [Bacteroidales bacterium]
MDNLINFTLTNEEKSKLTDAFITINGILAPKLVNLKPEDIKNMVHMGNRNMGFVIKAREIADKNKDLVPEFIDLEAFRTDLDSTVTLRELYRGFEDMAQTVKDSLMLAGSEALQAALAFYSYLKLAAKSNVSGAETAYNELSEYFPGRGSKTTDEENMETA